MSPPTVIVACLCAAWCRLCDDYQPVLHATSNDLAAAGLPLQWYWIDIEDEAELVGEFDVETFPTLVLIDAAGVRFAGPVTPQPTTLQRLLRALLAEAGAGNAQPAMPPEAVAFADRLRQRIAAGGLTPGAAAGGG
jgi:thioredoxin-like negative regulator of GroEL